MADIAEGIGLSREYICHPGETLADFLKDRRMSQKELAIRMGVTTAQVRAVIHGKEPITGVFAHKLEYALGVGAYFWLNIQSDYDREIAEYEDFHSITEDEIALLPQFKDITDDWKKHKVVKKDVHPAQLVMKLRRELRISNLCDLSKLPNGVHKRPHNK